jgi:TfoX/Sxy family transcriptional regulator of competence genes
MAYDEEVAARIRDGLATHRAVEEKKMFGGIAFMLRGHMCIGVIDDELMVRVGPDAYEDALSRPHAREMDFTGKPITGYVYVGRAGFKSSSDLKAWIERGTKFVLGLPPKKMKAAKIKKSD